MANAGEEPLFGGREYAVSLVNTMDLHILERKEASLGKFLKDLRHKFQEWERTEQLPDPSNPQS